MLTLSVYFKLEDNYKHLINSHHTKEAIFESLYIVIHLKSGSRSQLLMVNMCGRLTSFLSPSGDLEIKVIRNIPARPSD